MTHNRSEKQNHGGLGRSDGVNWHLVYKVSCVQSLACWDWMECDVVESPSYSSVRSDHVRKKKVKTYGEICKIQTKIFIDGKVGGLGRCGIPWVRVASAVLITG